MLRPRIDKVIRAGRGLRYEVAAFGVALTFLVAGLDAVGALGPLEHYLGDVRIAHFPRGRPDDKERLVHLDLDDGSLDAIGRWPWKRVRQAAILEELARAKPKDVALDITFSDVEEAELRKTADGKVEAVDGDRALADAIAHLGDVTLAASVQDQRQASHSRDEQALLSVLSENLNLTREEAAAALRSQQHVSDAEAARVTADDYVSLRKEAVDRRVAELLAQKPYTVEQLKAALGAGGMLYTPVEHLIPGAYIEAASVLALGRFTVPRPAGLMDVYAKPVYQAPLPEFVRAAAGAGAVTYLPNESRDGRVRSVPLFVELDGRLLPELGFALACRELGADLGRARITPTAIRLMTADGEVRVIPVSTRRIADGSTIGLMFDLPWFGTGDWKTMYDPAHKAVRHHLGIVELWDAITTEDFITTNLKAADDAIACLIDECLADHDKARAYAAAAKAAPADWGLRARNIDWLIPELRDTLHEPAKPAKPTDPEVDRRVAASWVAVHDVRDQIPRLERQLADKREKIAREVGGKSVIVGWTANGIGDFVSTPLHARCPGVVVHGLVFNAIMTGAFVRPAPAWATLAATLFAGLVTTLAVCWPSIIRGLIGAAVVATGYTLFDAAFLYQGHGIAMGMAGPAAAGVAVWTGCTLFRFLKERAEREALKKRFQSYVDPKIVQYVLEHPEQDTFAGQQREMSVVFTDLAGFTTISERLGARTVELLNEYFALMVPIIRANHGVLNKFLGDGMMFFFNAPQPNASHARDAVSAVLQMQHTLRAFNDGLRERGLPPVAMRCGITSGPMIVGDAGDKSAADYTVLGDNVNLASRLESANKAAGTMILCSERTIELLRDGGGFLARPVGRLQVVGKTEWVMTYEIMCHESEATAEQRRVAETTGRVVDAYIAGEFATCEAVCDELEGLTGGGKLIELYREMCDHCREKRHLGEFHGEIVLEQK